MKKLFSILALIAVLCISFTLVNPSTASADLPNRPVGLVILDHSGRMDGKAYKAWRSMVKLAYYFPKYQIIDDDPKPTQVVKEFLSDGVKISKTSMGDMAEKAGVDVLIIMPVYGCDSHMIPTMGPFGDSDLKYWVDARAKIFIYKKDGDKFSKKTVNEIGVRLMSEDYDPVDIIQWALSKQVNSMEGLPVIGRDL